MRHVNAKLIGTWISIVVLVATNSVRAEGTWQLGLGQRLVDDTVIKIDIQRGGEVIHLLAATDVGTSLGGILVAPDGRSQTLHFSAENGMLPSDSRLPEQVCNPMRVVADVGGTWTFQFRVGGVRDAWVRTVSVWDIQVSDAPSACVSVRNTSPIGRVHSVQWHVRSAGYAAGDASEADFYVLTPSKVWILDFAGLSGYEYFVSASRLGLSAPYARTSRRAAGLDRPRLTTEYELYLGPPATTLATISARDAAEIAAIRPTESGWELDVRVSQPISWNLQRGDEAVSATHVGTFEPGLHSLRIPREVGTENIGFRVRTGECHFAPYDVESARPGVAIHGWANGARLPTQMFWDDREIESGEALEDSSPVANVGRGMSSTNSRHGWGQFSAESLGNDAWVDTWVYHDEYVIPLTLSITGSDAGTDVGFENYARGGLAGGACTAVQGREPRPLSIVLLVATLGRYAARRARPRSRRS